MILSVLLLFVMVVLGLAGGAVYYIYWNFNRAGDAIAAQDIVIPSGSGVSSIARLLATRGVIDDPQLFVVGLRLFGGPAPLRAGEYRFAAHTSARDAALVLQLADPVIRRLTIAEGLTTAEILAQVAASEGLDGKVPEVKEGTLLPETYHYAWGDSRVDLVVRMHAAMTRELADLWNDRAAELPFDDPQEAVILASIVEKETGRADERARVAAVFINRLNRGMRLQSDPTTVYAITKGAGPLGRPLSRADLKLDDPYNTYVVRGLPPGPIANPGRASIAAVLDPADTEELYFVADGKGGHAFARSLTEHNRNVARWRKHLRKIDRNQK